MKDKNSLFNLINKIEAIDNVSIKKAQFELDRKMKPKDSLGVLEEICKKVAGIYGYPLKKIEKKWNYIII